MKYYITRLAEDDEGKLTKQFVSNFGLSGFCDLQCSAQEFDSLQEANATANALETLQRVIDSIVSTGLTVCYKIEEKKVSENVYGKEWRKMTGGVQ